MQTGRSEVHQVDKYKYVGHQIRIDKYNQTCKTHLFGLGWLGWATSGKLRDTLKGNLPICLKRRVYEQCILPVITYGAKTLILVKTVCEQTYSGPERNGNWRLLQ